MAAFAWSQRRPVPPTRRPAPAPCSSQGSRPSLLVTTCTASPGVRRLPLLASALLGRYGHPLLQLSEWDQGPASERHTSTGDFHMRHLHLVWHPVTRLRCEPRPGHLGSARPQARSPRRRRREATCEPELLLQSLLLGGKVLWPQASADTGRRGGRAHCPCFPDSPCACSCETPPVSAPSVPILEGKHQPEVTALVNVKPKLELGSDSECLLRPASAPAQPG